MRLFNYLIIFIIFFKFYLYSLTNCYVLCYHTFLGKNFSTDFSIETLEEHIKSIQELGYNFVSFSDIISNNIKGNKNILITIDDGNISVKNAYEKVFKKYNIKPHLFIYPAVINRKYYALTYDDLKYFLDEGCSIGAHGYYHLYLNEELYTKDKKGFLRELKYSKQVLEKKLNLEIISFAYPFGLCYDFTKDELKKIGYKYAFSLKRTSLKLPIEKNDDLFDLPRYMVTKYNWKNIYKILKNNKKNNIIS